MNLQPTLENKLLKIRPLNNSNLESLFEIAKNPNIWEQHPCKRYLRTEFEKFFFESIESKGALTIFDKTTDKIIGSSRYKKFDGFPNIVEIGWTFIDIAYWGGKYNKAAKNLMIKHAFNFVNKIIFYVDKDNIRSQRAVEKIGGQRITLESKFEQLPQTGSDNLTFIIENEKPAGNNV